MTLQRNQFRRRNKGKSRYDDEPQQQHPLPSIPMDSNRASTSYDVDPNRASSSHQTGTLHYHKNKSFNETDRTGRQIERNGAYERSGSVPRQNDDAYMQERFFIQTSYIGDSLDYLFPNGFTKQDIDFYMDVKARKMLRNPPGKDSFRNILKEELENMLNSLEFFDEDVREKIDFDNYVIKGVWPTPDKQ